MRLSQVHVYLLGVVIALSCNWAHRRLGLKSRGVPSMVGDFSKTLDGAINGVDAEKGASGLGHLTGASGEESMHSDHHFPENIEFDWETLGSSPTDSSKSSSYDEVVRGASNGPDSNTEPVKAKPLADFFRGTRDPHIQKVSKKISPPREKGSKLKRIFEEWGQKLSRSKVVKWLKGTKSSATSPHKPEFSGVSSIWSKITNKFRSSKGSHPGPPVPDSRPATGTASQNRTWVWMKSLWRKIAGRFAGRTPVHPEPGSRSVSTATSPTADKELVQETKEAQELKRYSRVLTKTGSLLAHPPEEAEGFLDEAKLVKKFKEALTKEGFAQDKSIMGKKMSLLMKHSKTYTTVNENLAKFSKEFLEWEGRFTNELSKSFDTWILENVKDLLQKSTLDGISGKKSKTIERKFYSKAKKLVSTIPLEQQQAILDGLYSKDIETNENILKGKSAGNFHNFMNNIKSKLRPADQPARKLQAILENRITSRKNEDIQDFIENMAVKQTEKIKESYKATINSQRSQEAHIKALADLTTEKLVEDLPQKTELAQEFYSHQLIKGFEDFLKPFQKDAERFIKARVKADMEPILHDRNLMENNYRGISENLIKLNHNGVVFDKLFRDAHNFKFGHTEVIEMLKRLFKTGLICGGKQCSTEERLVFLYNLKQKGILNYEEHYKLDVAALKSNENYEKALKEVLDQSQQLHNNLHEAIKRKAQTPMNSDEENRIFEKALNLLVEKEVNSLGQKAKSIYMEPGFLSSNAKLPVSKVIDLYSEKGINEFLDSELSRKDTQRFYSEIHFSHAVSTARPVENKNSKSVSKNKAILSVFLNDIGVDERKFSKPSLIEDSLQAEDTQPLFDERILAFKADPLKVGDRRLKGTHFEDLDQNSINELNSQVSFIENSMPQIAQDLKMKSKSWKAIEKITSSPEVKNHMDLITKVLGSLTDNYSNEGSKVWYALDPVD